MSDEHTPFDAWAAGIYAKDQPIKESIGAACFAAMVLLIAAFSPLIWLINHIKRDL